MLSICDEFILHLFYTKKQYSTIISLQVIWFVTFRSFTIFASYDTQIWQTYKDNLQSLLL